MHPFDAKGERRHYKDIPKSITDLVDDPFRSLAGELRRAGGFAKDTTPFSEFLWADFLRRRMKRKLVDRDFARAVEKAMQLAKSEEANYLPGWCAPHPINEKPSAKKKAAEKKDAGAPVGPPKVSEDN